MKTIYYWCDGTWCDSDRELELSLHWKSDDFTVMQVPDTMDSIEVDELVHEKVSM